MDISGINICPIDALDPRVPSHPETLVAESPEELHRITPDWLSLRQQYGLMTPNADPDRFEATVRALGANVIPHVVLLRDASGPGAVIVARRAHCGVQLRLGYWTFRTPALPCLEVVYGGLITKPTETWRARAADYLASLLYRRAVGYIFVNQLPVDDPVYEALTRHPWLSQRLGPPNTGIVLRQRLVPWSYAKTMAQHRGRTLRKWRNRHQRLTEDCGGQLQIRLFDGLDQIDRLFTDVCWVASRTYQAGLGVAFNDSRLSRETVRTELERKCFRAYVMYAGMQPIAFALGTVVTDALVVGALGYLPQYARRSPGLLLLLHVTEQACAEGLSWVDYGFGESELKQLLCTDSIRTSSLRFYARGLAPRAVWICETVMTHLSHAGAQVLAHAGWVARLKKHWRAKLSAPTEEE